MSNDAVPTFDEWVEYSFTLGYSDFHAKYDSPGYGEVELREQRFVNLAPDVLARYFIQLFESPQFIADRYSDDQIDSAIWFLFGCGSEYFEELWSDAVSKEQQIKCMTSVVTIYTELFDHICCKRAADPDGEYIHDLDVDGAVYMIWDMDGIDGANRHPDQHPHLVEPVFKTLETILSRCRTSTCQMSALHGLGHLHPHHPQRTERIIDCFLKRQHVADFVKHYALTARVGCVL